MTGVDNNAIQDGFNLYQQYFLVSDEGEWTAISQGMNKDNSPRPPLPLAFAYRSDHLVAAPHTGIAGIEDQSILNLVDENAGKLCSPNMVALTNEKPIRDHQGDEECRDA